MSIGGQNMANGLHLVQTAPRGVEMSRSTIVPVDGRYCWTLFVEEMQAPCTKSTDSCVSGNSRCSLALRLR
jgi:hypothetical protein